MRKTIMTQHAFLRKLRKKTLKTLILISIIFISACNAFSPSETTFIVNYPPPRIVDFYVSESQLNGEIAITLNPSINNDLSEYWLVIDSASSIGGLSDTLGEINDIYDLEATPEVAINNFYMSLTNVNSYFSGRSVNNYIFSNLALPNSSAQDIFYRIGARAWGSNDSYALAYQHTGWIVSPLSETLTFYIGYETNLCIVPGTSRTTGVGYQHRLNPTPLTQNPNSATHTQTPCGTTSSPPSTYTNQDSSIIEVGTNGTSPTPDIVFYSSPTETRIAVSKADIQLIPRTLGERLGNIVDISTLMPTDGITSDITEGFIVQSNSTFFIKHLNGHYSKLLIENISTNGIEIQLLYTGTNGANLEQF